MTTDTIGGVWTYAVQLAEALQPHGVEMALATLGEPSAQQRSVVERLPNVRLFTSRFKLEWMQDPWEDVRAAGLWLLRIADEVQPDVVHLNDYSQGALSWPDPVLVVGHSCVVSWHRAVRGCEAGSEWGTYRRHVRAGLRGADLVVAPTRTMLRWLDEFYGPLARRRVIPNGIDTAATPARSKEQLVLAAGRLWDEAKNIAALATAADQIGWPVYVAGDARHPDGGTSEFANVHLLGRLEAGPMGDWFSRASIYALPARYEPFGLTPVEAALAGCALVLGDIPTLKEVWGEAALFVPPDDTRALADAVNRLIRNPSLRREYVAHAQARASKFTAERMAAQYMAAYEELLTKRAAPHLVQSTGDA